MATREEISKGANMTDANLIYILVSTGEGAGDVAVFCYNYYWADFELI